jgi:hypothetical protein
MKNSLIIILILTVQTFGFAQTNDETGSFTYGEFRLGYGISSFGEGLKERYDGGNFSTSGGLLASVGLYRKFKKIDHLNFGIKYKSLGAFPSKGDNGQELFFNYWGASASIKYFPFDKMARKGIYLQTDYSFINQFTRKYRTVSKLEYDHQFALGNGIVFGLGYDMPIGAKRTMFTIGFEYEYNTRIGEVTGIGKKTFVSSNFGVLAGIKF